MEELVAVLVFLMIIMLIIYGIGWIGAGLAGPLGAFVIWLGQQWPGSPEYAPYFVLITLFLSFHLLLTPYYLKLARYAGGRNDRGKALSKGDLDFRTSIALLLLAAGDSVFLLLLMRTVHSMSDWPAASGKLMRLPEGILPLCLLLLILFIADMLATMWSIFLAQKNFAMLAKIAGFQTPDLGINESGLATFSQGIMIYYPVFIGLWIAYPKSNLLFTMVVCLLLTKVMTRGFFEFVSLAVDSQWKKESHSQQV